MQVPATGAAPPTSLAKSTTATKNMVDYNSFLQLLVTQMKNQDPTNPTDSTQFLSQLASFSGVEQAVQTNAKLDVLLTSSSLAQAEGLVGRNLLTLDGKVGGQVAAVTLSGGKLVATLTSGATINVADGVTVS